MYNVKRVKQFYRKDSNMEWEDIMELEDLSSDEELDEQLWMSVQE